MLTGDPETHSPYVRRRAESEMSECSPQPFVIHDDVKISLYISEAPCGDASMELVIDEQDDAAPWKAPLPLLEGDTKMLGRGHFDALGIVRRKPCEPNLQQATIPIVLTLKFSSRRRSTVVQQILQR